MFKWKNEKKFKFERKDFEIGEWKWYELLCEFLCEFQNFYFILTNLIFGHLILLNDEPKICHILFKFIEYYTCSAAKLKMEISVFSLRFMACKNENLTLTLNFNISTFWPLVFRFSKLNKKFDLQLLAYSF